MSTLYISSTAIAIIIIETRTSGDVGTLCHMIIVVLTCCVSCIAECDKYIQIFVYSNIFDTNIFRYCSCQLFGYKYIRIFVRGKILIRIYSDIRSYQFSGHKQIQKMFLLIFSGYYTLLMDILLISMIKNAI